MRKTILNKHVIYHLVRDAREKVFQICLEDILLSLVISGIANVIFALDPAESVVWQVYIHDQISIDAFLDIFQFLFWRIKDSRPILATVNSDILRFILSLVPFFVRLDDSDSVVKLFYAVHNIPHPFLRFAENDVAKYIGFLNKHIKNKGDVTRQASS